MGRRGSLFSWSEVAISATCPVHVFFGSRGRNLSFPAVDEVNAVHREIIFESTPPPRLFLVRELIAWAIKLHGQHFDRFEILLDRIPGLDSH